MMSNRKQLIIMGAVLLLGGCFSIGDKKILPDVPGLAEAVSLTGEALYPMEPSPSTVEKQRKAMADWKEDKSDPDRLIWYGRWTAYCGHYREAIRIFTLGTARFPDDARILRHRGHRYISIREFGRAVDDFERAALMVIFAPDEVEPDGMPNPANTPVSTLKSNIYYHLGLAKYLMGDVEAALEAWRHDSALNVNDDMRVATTHWIFTALSDLGRREEAMEALNEITSDMNIIENHSYHRLCLFYKGEIDLHQLDSGENNSSIDDAMLYGIGAWHLNNGNTQKASEYFFRIFMRGSWASFGFIAAEVRMSAI